MVRLPDKFRDEYNNHGDTFFAVAELLYTHPGRHFTIEEIAAEVDVTERRVNDFTEKLEEEWFDRYDNQTTFTWNTDKHDPAQTETTQAVTDLYTDLWRVLKRHTKTGTGTYAIFGLVMFTTAGVMWAFYLGFLIGLVGESVLPVGIYFWLGVGLFVTGIIATILAPIQAVTNRYVWQAIDRLRGE